MINETMVRRGSDGHGLGGLHWTVLLPHPLECSTHQLVICSDSHKLSPVTLLETDEMLNVLRFLSGSGFWAEMLNVLRLFSGPGFWAVHLFT